MGIISGEYTFPNQYVTATYDQETNLLKVYVAGSLAFELKVNPEANTYQTKIWEPNGETNGLVMDFETQILDEFRVDGYMPMSLYVKAMNKEHAKEIAMTEAIRKLKEKDLQDIQFNTDVEPEELWVKSSDELQ